MKKNDERFHTLIQKASIMEEKEAMYHKHKHRFKGFIFDTLEEFLYAESGINIFDTYELCVYDKEELIALSYFDIGNQSLAGLMGLFDENYSKHSLGTYTMLKELEFALLHNKAIYYPGYILAEYDVFNYKLRLGEMEFYDWKGNWKPIELLQNETFIVPLLKAKTQDLKQCFQSKNVPFQKLIYPLFSLGYFDFFG